MTHGLYHRSKNRVWCKDAHFRSVLSLLLSKKREVSFPLWLKLTDIQRALNFHFSLAPWPDILLGCATLPSKHRHAHAARLHIMRHQMRAVISSFLTGWMQMRSHQKKKKKQYLLVIKFVRFVASFQRLILCIQETSGLTWTRLKPERQQSVYFDECHSSYLKPMKNCDQISSLRLNLPLKDTSVSRP